LKITGCKQKKIIKKSTS